MKKKKQIVFGIFCFLLGIFMSSGFIYAATLYTAQEVSYDNTNSGSMYTNVQEVIDELYEKAQTAVTKNYIFKDGEFSITPTANNAVIDSTTGWLHYKPSLANNEILNLNIPYAKTGEVVYVKMRDNGSGYDAASLRTESTSSDKFIQLHSNLGWNLREDDFIIALPTSNIIYLRTINQYTAIDFYIKEIWTEPMD